MNPTPPRPTDPQVRLLLVDDHPLVRDGLRLRLESVPQLRVIGEADDGHAALAFLHACEQRADAEQALPQLVLMDLNMRGMGGLELAERVHEQWPQIAMLVLSMHDNVEYTLQAIRAGARGYLLKDEPAGEIVTAIGHVISGRTYFSPAVSMRLSSAMVPTALLSPREKEILRHIGQGAANKQIASALHLSVRTVETHRQNIKRKLGIEGQAELVKFAVENRGL